MVLKRREALTLAAGIALAGATSDSANACSHKPLGPFKASRAEKSRMAAKIEALRSHWNAGTIEQFLRDHCSEYVQVNLFLDHSRGGNWREPLAALRMFRERHKRIVSAFPDTMFDPHRPHLFSIVEFEPPPVRPPGPDDEITACAGGPVSTFAIFMRFDTTGRSGKSVLVDGDRIISGISFRENGQLSGWFESNRL